MSGIARNKLIVDQNLKYRRQQINGDIRDVKDVILTLDTAAYAIGDVLSVPLEIPFAVVDPGGACELKSLVVVDTDNNGVAMDILFLRSNVSIGAINTALSLSDVDATSSILGKVSLVAGDFSSYTNGKFTFKSVGATGMGGVMNAAPGSHSIWIATVTQAVATWTIHGISLKIGLRQ